MTRKIGIALLQQGSHGLAMAFNSLAVSFHATAKPLQNV